MSNINERFPDRKKLAKGVIQIDGQPTIVFDTVCTRNRVRWLANDDVHGILREVWSEATAWLFGRYVIMPDHIHFFAGHRDGDIQYENWVKYWKSKFSKRFKRPELRWQDDGFDTRMKSVEKYEEKWNYVLQNPVRAGLVEKAEDWVYQGEIFELRWG